MCVFLGGNGGGVSCENTLSCEGVGSGSIKRGGEARCSSFLFFWEGFLWMGFTWAAWKVLTLRVATSFHDFPDKGVDCVPFLHEDQHD